MNPADLFTKHLPGEDKIKSLVKLLSCEFRGGRAATAPKLRSPDAAATQELLAADEYYIQHEEKTFPAVEYEGEFVVEAYAHTHDILPHLHRELNSLFPRAVAREEEAEGEDTSPCGFETRGEALVKSGDHYYTTNHFHHYDDEGPWYKPNLHDDDDDDCDDDGGNGSGGGKRYGCCNLGARKEK